jgi:hypothetical protein
MFIGCGADGFVQAVANLAVARWFRFRFQVITSFIEEVYGFATENYPDKEIGLDVWTPAYAWLVGQNYRSLAGLCHWVKPMVYPIDGPAGLAGELIALISGLTAVNPDLDQDQAVRQACRFFGFDADKSPTMEKMIKRGFPDSIYESELRRAKVLMNRTRPVRAGCPIFDGSPKRVRDRVRRARTVETDGIILYCYDLAPFDHLEAAGKALAE